MSLWVTTWIAAAVLESDSGFCETDVTSRSKSCSRLSFFSRSGCPAVAGVASPRTSDGAARSMAKHRARITRFGPPDTDEKRTLFVIPQFLSRLQANGPSSLNARSVIGWRGCRLEWESGGMQRGARDRVAARWPYDRVHWCTLPNRA